MDRVPQTANPPLSLKQWLQWNKFFYTKSIYYTYSIYYNLNCWHDRTDCTWCAGDDIKSAQINSCNPQQWFSCGFCLSLFFNLYSSLLLLHFTRLFACLLTYLLTCTFCTELECVHVHVHIHGIHIYIMELFATVFTMRKHL